MELRNADLASWKDDYLANMAEASRSRQRHQAPRVAKKNAAQYVAGLGIGDMGRSTFLNPLTIFAGDSLLGMLTGARPVAGRKRDREHISEEDTDSETRRQRLRGNEEDFGRGKAVFNLDNDVAMQIDDVSARINPLVTASLSLQS